MRIFVFASSIMLGFLAIQTYIHYKIKSGVQVELNKERIKLQNEAIAKKAVDTKNYIKSIPKIEEKIITKYKNVSIKDTSCEGKLKEIENAMDLYFDTTAHY